ncbi:MAG: siroheme synthase CysG [Gammaproteobacteria bacterium]
MFTPNLAVFLKLKDQTCVVVGGGEIALRKIRALLKTETTVIVIAPDLCNDVLTLVKTGQILHESSSFSEASLEKCNLVIAATNNKGLNRKISNLAQKNNVLVNVVDDPALCTFIMPSVIERLPVQIAISTGGNSPVLARLLRSKLETLIPSSYGKLASLMGQFREQAKQKIPDLKQRRNFWEHVLQSSVAELLFSGQEKTARLQLEKFIEKPDQILIKTGTVALIGCGPGDPDLLTFRALRLMQQADVILFDRLVSDQIVDLSRKDAERIYVGKKRDNHTLPQESINELLVRLAKEGKHVVRLKGGDPFIFGRGGEEIETLSDEGISFQVVPGITAASGCASYAGIPLTHRDYAQSCIFVTGHLKDGTVDLNWDSLAHENQTIVIYMGLIGLRTICVELIAHGMDQKMPVALIEQGTTSEQKNLIGTLETMPDLVESKTVKPPTLIIIGEVVKLNEKLNWFSSSR